MSELLLEARELRRSFQVGKQRVEVLQNVNLQVFHGEAIFIRGASGAGKTTLLYTLAGLERPEAGQVLFEGTSLYEIHSNQLTRLRNARMGFVFQSYFLLPELTALENILLPALIAGRRPEASARELLDKVQLSHRAHHLPAELSGGEQQRVAIARALINGPGVLFADEPTGNLDSRTGESIIELLLGLVRRERRTLIVVTHDGALAQKGDREIHIEDGAILQ
ncbi:MAG: ABC transporter [Verrucomicrobia bacterium]|nr:MAG: ABC transporter [Verrucomicrobiota bacterium]